MNWGNKLLLVFVAFGSMMSFMVYRCMKQPVNLVSKEYYRDEIAFQEVIDSRAKTNALSSKIKLSESEDAIGITMPAEMKRQKMEGNILLYCPANARYDRQFTLQADSAAFQALPKKEVTPGSYIVKISWRSNNVNYYSEEPLIIH